jgi:hypothetical protein
MIDKSYRPMSVRQRKALLALHGLTPTNIARGTGRNVRTVCTIINRYPEKKSRPIQEYIAQHTNKCYEQIWGTVEQKWPVNGNGHHSTTVADNKKVCK